MATSCRSLCNLVSGSIPQRFVPGSKALQPSANDQPRPSTASDFAQRLWPARLSRKPSRPVPSPGPNQSSTRDVRSRAVPAAAIVPSAVSAKQGKPEGAILGFRVCRKRRTSSERARQASVKVDVRADVIVSALGAQAPLTNAVEDAELAAALGLQGYLEEVLGLEVDSPEDIRSAQALLEHTWQLPNAANGSSETRGCIPHDDVEAYLANVKARRRKSSRRSKSWQLNVVVDADMSAGAESAGASADTLLPGGEAEGRSAPSRDIVRFSGCEALSKGMVHADSSERETCQRTLVIPDVQPISEASAVQAESGMLPNSNRRSKRESRVLHLLQGAGLGRGKNKSELGTNPSVSSLLTSNSTKNSQLLSVADCNSGSSLEVESNPATVSNLESRPVRLPSESSLEGTTSETSSEVTTREVATSDSALYRDVLVKFPGFADSLQRSDSSLVGRLQSRRRRSLDAAAVAKRLSVEMEREGGVKTRVVVRSSRRRRLSLGSRMDSRQSVREKGNTSTSKGRAQEIVQGNAFWQLEKNSAGQSAEAEAGAFAAVAAAPAEIDVLCDQEADKLLKGYGWKGVYAMQWDPKRPLLTEEEEKRVLMVLGKARELLDAQEELAKKLGRVPSPEEASEKLGQPLARVLKLPTLYKAAQNKLVMHNLGLVVSIAGLYRSTGFGVDFTSLCQRGVKGLYDATHKFSLKRNCRFSTFATVCIRTVITREVAASLHVRAPTYSTYKYLLMKRSEQQLEEQLKRKPTDIELARAVKVGVSQLKLIRRMFDGRPEMLHREVGSTGMLMAEILADKSQGWDEGLAPDLEERSIGAVDGDSIRYALDDVIDSLKPHEAVVIRQRFGLDGCGKRTLAEVGRNLAVSKQMVNKYEAQAMAKLKLPQRTEMFKSRVQEYC